MATTSSGTQSRSEHLCSPSKPHEDWELLCRHHPKDPSWNLHQDLCPLLGRARGFLLQWTGRRGPSPARHLAMGRDPSAAMLLVLPWGRLGKPFLKDLQSHVRGKRGRGETRSPLNCRRRSPPPSPSAHRTHTFPSPVNMPANLAAVYLMYSIWSVHLRNIT